ncbi:hypothetical protein FCV25MIE_24878, partial [Fagus crenata]
RWSRYFSDMGWPEVALGWIIMKMKMRMKVVGGAITIRESRSEQRNRSREKENMKSGRESIFTVSEGGEIG